MLVIKYVIFAVFSIIVNVFFQWLSFLFYNGDFNLYVSMAIVTIAGLITKYILDKKYIFYYTSKNIVDDSAKFFLYSFMGIFTTIIFWGIEISFEYLLEFSYARYIGAVIGLSIGYFIKYQLDKKFVFKVVRNCVC